MLKNLLPLYTNSLYADTVPANDAIWQYSWFFEEGHNGFVGIPTEDLTEKELLLLEQLFQKYTPNKLENRLNAWYQFLYEEGPIPVVHVKKRFRAIQLYCSGERFDRKDFEQALKGFLSDEISIIWEKPNRAVVIEIESTSNVTEEEFLALIEVLENDAYVKTTLYIGKFTQMSDDFRKLFEIDRSLFIQALEIMKMERLITFEKVFPVIMATELPIPLLETLDAQLFRQLEGDLETLTTLKVYLENNLNASVTAKKLYIHRNTLQYRLDKFAEKTGVNLKDFSSAVTLYITCLLQEKKEA